MGMCKECGQVNSVLEMDGEYCKKCAIGESSKENTDENLLVNQYKFGWWETWAWLGLTLGNLMTFGQLVGAIEFALVFILINSVLMILILKYNKYAFLVATILSFNPLLWIINGIYLKNRWCHPKVNHGIACS